MRKQTKQQQIDDLKREAEFLRESNRGLNLGFHQLAFKRKSKTLKVMDMPFIKLEPRGRRFLNSERISLGHPGDIGLVTHLELRSRDGKMKKSLPIGAPKVLSDGDCIAFAPGSFSITL